MALFSSAGLFAGLSTIGLSYPHALQPALWNAAFLGAIGAVVGAVISFGRSQPK